MSQTNTSETSTSVSTESAEVKKSTLRTWLARFGIAGFLFFFIKGLLWLIAPALLVWYSTV